MLTPLDAAGAGRVRDIVLHGRGAELRCIETEAAGGEVQRTLLAGAARDAGSGGDAAAAAALCGNGNGNDDGGNAGA